LPFIYALFTYRSRALEMSVVSTVFVTSKKFMDAVVEDYTVVRTTDIHGDS